MFQGLLLITVLYCALVSCPGVSDVSQVNCFIQHVTDGPSSGTGREPGNSLGRRCLVEERTCRLLSTAHTQAPEHSSEHFASFHLGIYYS
jgi:hypothetical protein